MKSISFIPAIAVLVFMFTQAAFATDRASAVRDYLSAGDGNGHIVFDLTVGVKNKDIRFVLMSAAAGGLRLLVPDTTCFTKILDSDDHKILQATGATLTEVKASDRPDLGMKIQVAYKYSSGDSRTVLCDINQVW